MAVWLNDFQSITKVIYHEPSEEIAERYPFACVFKEADKDEACNPDLIAGIWVDFGGGEQYVVCATTDEILVFSSDRECEEAEQERLGIKPSEVKTEAVPTGPIPGKILLPGQQPQQTSGAIVEEKWGRAWSVTAMTSVPTDKMAKIKKLLGKAL